MLDATSHTTTNRVSSKQDRISEYGHLKLLSDRARKSLTIVHTCIALLGSGQYASTAGLPAMGFVIESHIRQPRDGFAVDDTIGFE
jgi:hypothetical protein